MLRRAGYGARQARLHHEPAAQERRRGPIVRARDLRRPIAVQVSERHGARRSVGRIQERRGERSAAEAAQHGRRAARGTRDGEVSDPVAGHVEEVDAGGAAAREAEGAWRVGAAARCAHLLRPAARAGARDERRWHSVEPAPSPEHPAATSAARHSVAAGRDGRQAPMASEARGTAANGDRPWRGGPGPS